MRIISQIQGFHRSQSGHLFRRDGGSSASDQSIIFQDRPHVVQFHSAVSDTSGNGLNNGNAFLHLRDKSDRPWTDSPAYDRLVTSYGHTPVLLGSVVRFVSPVFLSTT